MPLAVDTAGRIYDDFSRLLFLHPHRAASALANGYEDFYTARFVFSTFHTTSVFHSF